VRQRHDELERIQAVTELCSPVTDRQTDRQAINGRNNGLERVQRDMELSSPVTDRQTHTQAIDGK